MAGGRREEFLLSLLNGLGGWLAFQRATGRRQIQSEITTYPPIFEIAEGQGWIATPQYRLKSSMRRYDFLFTRSVRDSTGRKLEYGVVLEMKYGKQFSLSQRVVEDVEKLKSKALVAHLDRSFDRHCRALLLVYRGRSTSDWADGGSPVWEALERKRLRSRIVSVRNFPEGDFNEFGSRVRVFSHRGITHELYCMKWS